MIEIKARPNQDVIDMLDDLLSEAKNGRLQGVAIAGSLTNCQTFNCFTSGGYTMALLGEIHVLARDFTDCEIELRCPVSEPG